MTTAPQFIVAPAVDAAEADVDAATDPGAPIGVDQAHAIVEASALTPGTPGRVGLELESHLVDLVEPARRVSWLDATAAVADLPALAGQSLVTLEPGGQLELSGPPAPDVVTAIEALQRDYADVRRSLAERGLGLATVGADPLRSAHRINPGVRYAAMEQHFAAIGQGSAGRAMMCSTASLQVNLEAGEPAGWAERVELVHRLGPVLVAVSACSPWLAGGATDWRSARQQVWGELDPLRCGPPARGHDPAHEWATYALNAPVMLVHDGRGGAAPVTTVVPFRDWASGDRTLAGRRPTRSDLEYHLTTLFPPARLRGFLEIRYLDAAPGRWWSALAALTTILVDDDSIVDAVREATEPTARAWVTAAREGLADPALAGAARQVLALAIGVAPVPLRADLDALGDLVAAGRSPGDELSDAIGRHGPSATLQEVAHA